MKLGEWMLGSTDGRWKICVVGKASSIRQIGSASASSFPPLKRAGTPPTQSRLDDLADQTAFAQANVE